MILIRSLLKIMIVRSALFIAMAPNITLAAGSVGLNPIFAVNVRCESVFLNSGRQGAKWKDLQKKQVHSFSALRGQIDDFLIHAEKIGKNREALHSSADLFEIPFNDLLAVLDSSEVASKIRNDRYLTAYHEQIIVKIESLLLKTSRGPYPFSASLNGIEAARRFFSTLERIQTKFESKPIRLVHPVDDTNLMKSLLANPQAYYNLFRERLTSQGQNAKFPEMSASVQTLMSHLQNSEIELVAQAHRPIYIMRAQIFDLLQEVLQEGCPYKKTFQAIQDAVAFFDVYERGKPGSLLPSLHHSIRWQYHSSIMMAEAPEHILWPTQYSLSITDLLKLRGVPLGLVGTNPKPLFADGFYQSPIEFWFHDVNHSRRAWQQFVLRAEELGVSLKKYMQISNSFISEKILPCLKVSADDSVEEKNIKRIAKVIIFEIAHEEAMSLDQARVRELLARKPFENGKFVFESPNENGISHYTGPMASILTVTFRKLEGEFYDLGAMRMETLGSSEMRTRETVAKAGLFLNAQLQLNIDPAVLKANVQDDSGMPYDLRDKLIQRFRRDPKHTMPILETAAIQDYKSTGIMKKPVDFFFDTSGKLFYP